MKNLQLLPIAALVAVVVFLGIDSCNKQRKLDKLQDELSIATLKNQELDSIKNKLGQTVYTQEAVIVSTQQELQKLASEKFQLEKKHAKKIKEVTFFYEAKLAAKADSVFIPFPTEDTSRLNEVKRNCDTLRRFIEDSMIVVPKTVTLDTSRQEYKDGLRLTVSVNKKGVNVDSVGFENTQDIQVVKLKRNLWQFISFKPRKYRVDVLHSSPYFKVHQQNSVIFVDKKGAGLLGTILKVGVGVFIGTKL